MVLAALAFAVLGAAAAEGDVAPCATPPFIVAGSTVFSESESWGCNVSVVHEDGFWASSEPQSAGIAVGYSDLEALNCIQQGPGWPDGNGWPHRIDLDVKAELSASTPLDDRVRIKGSLRSAYRFSYQCGIQIWSASTEAAADIWVKGPPGTAFEVEGSLDLLEFAPENACWHAGNPGEPDTPRTSSCDPRFQVINWEQTHSLEAGQNFVLSGTSGVETTTHLGVVYSKALEIRAVTQSGVAHSEIILCDYCQWHEQFARIEFDLDVVRRTTEHALKFVTHKTCLSEGDLPHSWIELCAGDSCREVHWHGNRQGLEAPGVVDFFPAGYRAGPRSSSLSFPLTESQYDQLVVLAEMLSTACNGNADDDCEIPGLPGVAGLYNLKSFNCLDFAQWFAGTAGISLPFGVENIFGISDPSILDDEISNRPDGIRNCSWCGSSPVMSAWTGVASAMPEGALSSPAWLAEIFDVPVDEADLGLIEVSPGEPLSIALLGGSVRDGGVVRHAAVIDWGDDPVAELSIGPDLASHTYSDTGSREVRVTIVDPAAIYVRTAAVIVADGVGEATLTVDLPSGQQDFPPHVAEPPTPSSAFVDCTPNGGFQLVCCSGVRENDQLEQEVCYEDTNGGCNSAHPQYETIVAGQPLAGTAWSGIDIDGDGQLNRDTDWFLYEHPGGALRYSASADFPFRGFLLGVDDCANVVVHDSFDVEAGCGAASTEVFLPPGTYALWAGCQTWDILVECGTYTLTAESEGVACDVDQAAPCDAEVVLRFPEGSEAPSFVGGSVSCRLSNGWSSAGMAANAYDAATIAPGTGLELGCISFAIANEDAPALVEIQVWLDVDGGAPYAPGVDLEPLGDPIEYCVPPWDGVFEAAFPSPVVIPADASFVVTVSFPIHPMGGSWMSAGRTNIEPSGPTYVLYPACDINSFVDLEDIGFPGLEWGVSLGFTAAGTCREDLDNDGAVGFGDVLIVISSHGETGPADLDGDGVVGFGDLLQVLSAWGPCP